jgi:biotin synthase
MTVSTDATALDLAAVARRAIDERGIPRDLAERILELPADLDLAVLDAAFTVRRHFFGRRVRIHVLLNAKRGRCPEDCSFCSQSAHHPGADDGAHPLLHPGQILEAARRAGNFGAYRFCIVTATRGPSSKDLAALCPAVAQIKRDIPIGVCCSLGLLTDDQAHDLAAAGVDRFNHNLETSEARFGDVCSTHTWQDRADTVTRARSAGMGACCGGILGLEHTDADILDLAYSLKELDVESIPLNFLDPRPATPDAASTAPSPRRSLRMLALFRLIHPHRDLRAAGGREVNLRSLQALTLYAANSIFTEGYLTTGGATANDDLRMIRDAGFELERWTGHDTPPPPGR